jgi:hypothetical protein
MSTNDCACGTVSQRLGCLQCGAAVCPQCAIEMESATYCRGCASTLLGAAEVQPAEPFELQ